MAIIQDIPRELRIRIFTSIRAIRHLAQCRLVCKSWNNDAELVMFDKTVYLRSSQEISDLYEYFVKYPVKGAYIRNLEIISNISWNRTLLKLMDFVFTPNLEQFTGSLNQHEDHFYYKIYNIVQASPTSKFPKIKAIPASQTFSYMYFKTLLLFKDTLEKVDIHLYQHVYEDVPVDTRRIAKHLKDFKCLKSFVLSGPIHTIEELNNILKQCAFLEDLTLDVFHDNNTDLLSTTAVKKWILDNHVQQMHGLTTLKFYKHCRPDVLEYLIYKYPNVKFIEIDGQFDDGRYLNASIRRIVRAIKDLPHYEIKLKPALENHSTKDLIDLMKTVGNDVGVRKYMYFLHFRVKVQVS